MDEAFLPGKVQSAVCKGIYSSSLEDQCQALQMVLDHMEHLKKDDEMQHFLEPDEMQHFLKPNLLYRVTDILNASKNAHLKATALKVLFLVDWGLMIKWLDLIPFLTNYLLYCEEYKFKAVVDWLPELEKRKAVIRCLISHGIVDVLCIRITSVSEAQEGVKLLGFMFRIINRCPESQSTESIKVCVLANALLTQQEGMLASDDMQVACLQGLYAMVLNETSLEVFMQTDLSQILLCRLRTDKRSSSRAIIADVFINATSSDKGETKVLVDAGLLDAVIAVIRSKGFEDEGHRLEHSIFWLLANITGDCVELRNRVVQSGVDKSVVEAASSPTLSTNMRELFAWVLGNFFRPNAKGVPPEVCRNVLQCLKLYLNEDDDSQIVANALYALHFFTNPYDGSDHQAVDLMLELDIIPCVMRLLKIQTLTICKPAVQVVLNIVQSGKEAAAKFLLEHGLCSDLPNILQSRDLSRIKSDVIATLHSLAKFGHSEEICRHLPLSTMVHYLDGDQNGTNRKILEIFQIVAREAKSDIITNLDFDVIRQLKAYIVSNHSFNYLSSLMQEVMVLFEQAAKKFGIDFKHEDEDLE